MRQETRGQETSLKMRRQEASRKTRSDYKGHREVGSEEPRRDGTGREKEEARRQEVLR
jgi:hypothetical protein